MGGYGSGRQAYRSTVEEGLTVDLGLLLRRGYIKDGAAGFGSLSWSSNGETVATIDQSYDMLDPDHAHLILAYTLGRRGASPKYVEQRIRLVYTRPNYGGRRWWMICPISGQRVGKVHVPLGGDRFASRQAWRLIYRSQREARPYRAFGRLFRLQSRLGCEVGWGRPVSRPKGMWNSTFGRYRDQYRKLDALCAYEATVEVAKRS